MYGPGGSHVDPVWKENIVGFASKEIAKLQQDVGTKAEVIIDSGDVHKLLNRAAEQAKADLLVIGHMPSGGHLGENGSGYAIIRESHIPVLSVLRTVRTVHQAHTRGIILAMALNFRPFGFGAPATHTVTRVAGRLNHERQETNRRADCRTFSTNRSITFCMRRIQPTGW